ncbi:MAG: hypothetical protein ACTS73_00970 [Arsenophonus sp. NEOnobi-MAG3]
MPLIKFLMFLQGFSKYISFSDKKLEKDQEDLAGILLRFFRHGTYYHWC